MKWTNVLLAVIGFVLLLALFDTSFYAVGLIGRNMHVSFVKFPQNDAGVDTYTMGDLKNWAIDGAGWTVAGMEGAALLFLLFVGTMAGGYLIARIQMASPKKSVKT